MHFVLETWKFNKKFMFNYGPVAILHATVTCEFEFDRSGFAKGFVKNPLKKLQQCDLTWVFQTLFKSD